jgi:general secretion pathway protein J
MMPAVTEKTPPKRFAEHGFTLVEVMVALLIFGMIAAAGVAILSFSIRAQATTGTRLDDAAALGRTVSILSADLGQAVNRPTRDEGGTVRPAFVGDATSLSMVRLGWSNVDGAPRPAAQKVAYRLGSGTLERIAYPLLDGAAPLPAATLMTRVRAMRVRYRYNGGWSDRWDGAGGLPLPDAAEISLVRDDGTQWRTMVLVGTGYPGAAGG